MHNPFDAVREALRAGKRSVALQKATWDVPPPPAGAGACLRLEGLRGADIDFGGGELRGRAALRFFALADCEDVTIRNVVLDYWTPPFAQAEIVAADSGGVWTLRALAGYPAPDESRLGEIWPMQVYGRESRELVNPMRSGDGFRLEKTGPGLYRATGGGNRAGAVGDIAVWNVFTAGGEADLGGGAERNSVHLVRCRRCRFENVTAFATPGGRAFEEHSCEACEYVRCRVVRRSPDDDFAPREVPRLRSGGHDAFMSRRAVAGPRLDCCEARYHCDDAVNVSGVFAVVSAVRGRRVRLVSISASPFAPGDSAQVLGADGSIRPDRVVSSVAAAPAPASPEERTLLRSIGLWPGLAEQSPAIPVELELADAGGIVLGDALISDRAQGNGFAIRNCSFGHNRAFGMRIRASDGVIEGNVVEDTEGWGLFIGPEYEWLEGGVSHDLLVRRNEFRRCGATLGGTAAFRRPLPPDAWRNVRFEDNVFS